MKKLLIRTITGIFCIFDNSLSIFLRIPILFSLLFFTIIGNLELKKMGYHLSNAPQFIAPLLLRLIIFAFFPYRHPLYTLLHAFNNIIDLYNTYRGIVQKIPFYQ